jgi:hypothetical protein
MRAQDVLKDLGNMDGEFELGQDVEGLEGLRGRR